MDLPLLFLSFLKKIIYPPFVHGEASSVFIPSWSGTGYVDQAALRLPETYLSLTPSDAIKGVCLFFKKCFHCVCARVCICVWHVCACRGQKKALNPLEL